MNLFSPLGSGTVGTGTLGGDVPHGHGSSGGGGGDASGFDKTSLGAINDSHSGNYRNSLGGPD